MYIFMDDATDTRLNLADLADRAGVTLLPS